MAKKGARYKAKPKAKKTCSQQLLPESMKLIPHKQQGGEIMTKLGEVYLCEIGGNKVRVLEAGAGRLACCRQPMKLVKP